MLKILCGLGILKMCYFVVYYFFYCIGKFIVILVEKMVLGCNMIKELFNRNML